MGFWGSFLGNIAGHTFSDVQKQNRANKSWNDLFFEISDYEDSFNNFLASIGCIDQYTFDVSAVNNGNIAPEKRKIDKCRKKVNEYLNLGGKGELIYHIEDIDDYLKKIKILKKAGCVDRQEEFAFDFPYEVEEKLAEEENMKQRNVVNKKISRLEITNVMTINKSNNELYNYSTRFICEDNEINVFVDECFGTTNNRGKQLLRIDIKLDINSVNDILIEDIQNNSEEKYVHIFNETYIMDNTNAEKLKEFVLERIDVDYDDINKMSGVEFEKVCQQVIEQMGFETQTTKASGDGGIDLIAYNYQPLLSGKYIIQCKRYTGSVGEPIIRDLYGVVTAERANKGILMTTGHFTRSAIAFAEGKPIELIDGMEMQNLMRQHSVSISSKVEVVNNASYKMIDKLDGYEREFYEDNWNRFVSYSREFYEKLEEFDIMNGLSIKYNFAETMIPALKEYEAYIMASKIKTGFRDEQMLFSEILSAMNVEYEYEGTAAIVYSRLSEKNSELLDINKQIAIGTEGKKLGAFWSILLTSTKTSFDSVCLLEILDLHKKYIEELGCAIVYLVDEDSFLKEVTTEYYLATHNTVMDYIHEMFL